MLANICTDRVALYPASNRTSLGLKLINDVGQPNHARSSASNRTSLGLKHTRRYIPYNWDALSLSSNRTSLGLKLV